MKKKLLLLASMVAVVTACSKSDSGEDKKEPAPVVQQNENTFSVKIKDLFSVQGDPNKDITNILVGDTIPYEIEIKDDNPNGVDANYSLFASEKGNKNHQVLNRDYELYYENEGKLVKLERGKENILFKGVGKHKFYIKPLVPGSFQHIYSLQKQIDGKPVGDNLKRELLFAAVKITLYSKAHTRYVTKWRGKTSVNKWSYHFIIDDGVEEKDNYLSPAGFDVKYSVYEKNGSAPFAEGNLEVGKEIEFYVSAERERGFPEMIEQVKIHITQKIANQEEYSVDYILPVHEQ